ncbi:MAG: hypothetical protein FWG67_08520 [Defluviitaleaceae bacterium]|nr:hypothetical protein [Defluviitaleaceae bacterium]
MGKKLKERNLNRKISLDDTSVTHLRQVVLSTVRHETTVEISIKRKLN